MLGNHSSLLVAKTSGYKEEQSHLVFTHWIPEINRERQGGCERVIVSGTEQGIFLTDFY